MVRTINQSYQAQYHREQKRKIFFKIFLFLVLSGGTAGGLIYLLFVSKLFIVDEISIFSRNGNLEVRPAVESYLGEKKFFLPKFSNIFLVNSGEIAALLGEKFPSAENIKVEKEYFHGLNIFLDQKEAIGVWCYTKNGQCVYFDRHGIAFDSAAETSGTILLSVSDQKGNFNKLGQLAGDAEKFKLIVRANDELKKNKIISNKFIIPETEDFRLDVQTAEGWKIYLSTKDDLDRQLANLEIFLSQKVTREKRSQLVYIDLTVPNRVYYK